MIQEKIDLVLSIDDDFATNYYHEIVIREMNICHKFVTYSKPEEALVYFKSLVTVPDPSIPELVFLDINMPRMNGWEFLEEFATIPLQRLPIIMMLTNSSSPYDKEKVTSNKLIHGFLSKPLAAEYLLPLRNQIIDSRVLKS